jgi:hypothetical protein
MIVRVHDNARTDEWLIPAFVEGITDLAIVLKVEPQPTGPIELVDPRTCRPVAQAAIPHEGAGVLVQYGQAYEANQLVWTLTASVDTMLQDPTPAVPSELNPCGDSA